MEARERDPGSLHIVPMGIIPTQGKLAYLEEIGVTETALRLPSAPRDQVLPVLDEFTSYL